MVEGEPPGLGGHGVDDLVPTVADVHAPDAGRAVEVDDASGVGHLDPLGGHHDARTPGHVIGDGRERMEDGVAVEVRERHRVGFRTCHGHGVWVGPGED